MGTHTFTFHPRLPRARERTLRLAWQSSLSGAEDNKCSTFPRFTPFSFLCFFDKKYHRHKLLESTSPLIHLKRVPIYTSDDSYVYVKAINIQPYKRIDCLLYEKINEN